MIEFKLTGNWRGFQKAFEHLPFEIQSSAIWGQRKAGEKLVKIVKGHINKQDLGWEERSENTNSNDSRVLVDTASYYGAIKAWKDGNSYYVGVKSTSHDAKGRRISDYAILHEEGAPNLPARPLWGPSFEDIGGARGIRAIVLDAIYKKLERLRRQGFDITIGGL